MLFPSPRYGAEALVKLIESVDAEVMLTPEVPISVVEGVLSKRSMKTLQIPGVEQLLKSAAEPYPYNKTFQEHSKEPLICLRTYTHCRPDLPDPNPTFQIHLVRPASRNPYSGPMSGQTAQDEA